MVNIGKEQYNEISIPDEKLLAAIGRGIRKEKRQSRARWLRNVTAAAAGFVLLLFGCANIPVLYTYASEIPIFKTFVQALRMGEGGVQMEGVEAQVSADARSITFTFLEDGKATDKVLAYSAKCREEPLRLQMTFRGLGEDSFAGLKKKLEKLDAVSEARLLPSREENVLSFEILLSGIYNYELMEFSNPGSLTLRFYQDAYHTDGEKRPK